MPRMMFKTVFAAALLAAGAAWADEAQVVQPQVTLNAAAVAVPSLAPAQPAGAEGAIPLSLEEMGEIAGGDSVHVEVLSRQQLTGTATGNSVNATNFTTGAVNFSPDALSGFSGVGNFVINTGANNTLQGAINISVVTTPTP